MNNKLQAKESVGNNLRSLRPANLSERDERFLDRQASSVSILQPWISQQTLKNWICCWFNYIKRQPYNIMTFKTE